MLSRLPAASKEIELYRPPIPPSVPFCCSQLGTASAAKSNWPHHLPTYLPTTSHHGKPSAPEQTFGSCSGPLRGAPRPCGAPRRRRGRRLAPGPRPAPPRPTTDRPAARLPLDPSPAAPSPGRLTAHGALGCAPPPPRVPRRHACPCLDALCASRALVSGTDGAATAPAVAAPPPRRARCRRRRRRRLLAVSPSPRAATHAPALTRAL